MYVYLCIYSYSSYSLCFTGSSCCWGEQRVLLMLCVHVTLVVCGFICAFHFMWCYFACLACYLFYLDDLCGILVVQFTGFVVYLWRWLGWVVILFLFGLDISWCCRLSCLLKFNLVVVFCLGLYGCSDILLRCFGHGGV